MSDLSNRQSARFRIYRLRKSARRHKCPEIASSLVLFALLKRIVSGSGDNTLNRRWFCSPG